MIERNGALTDLKVLNDEYQLTGEVQRVLYRLPNWSPSQHKGEIVRSRVVQPIVICLHHQEEK